MEVVLLTALVGCVYAEAAAESWRLDAQWRHRLREIALALIYLSLASVKYLEVMKKVSHGYMA